MAALWSVSAAAQSSPGIPPPKDSRGVPIAREVKFEVLSLRPMPGPSVTNSNPTPSGFTSRLSAWNMIMVAYGPVDLREWGSLQVLKTPSWIGDFYDINARVSQADLKAWQSQSSEHELLRSAMRAALKERFNLTIHEQPAVGRTFELIVDKRVPRLKTAAPDSTLPVGVKTRSGGVMVGKTLADRKTEWDCHGITMQDLAEYLSILSPAVPVRDKTGLTGHYDFTLKEVELSPGEDHVYRFPLDQLGLKLKPGTENRPNLVVDHIDKPTAN
jgi:uncharacterized protein (TIGR03435 family)